MTTEKELEITEQVVEKVNKVQAGDMLRTKREELGVSQQDIADRLRLRLSIIQSIDQNNYEFDQVATFTRGYLRSYAKAVSLDEKEVLASLDGFKEAQHSEQKMQSFSRQTKKARHDSRIMKLTWIIFVIIVGISSVWWYQNQQDTLTEISNTDSTDSTATINLDTLDNNEPASPDRTQFEPVEAVTLPADLDGEVAAGNDVQPAMVETTTPEAAVTNQPETEIVIAEDTSAPVEKSGSELSLTFSADCWVQIKDATGKVFATGVKKAGSALNFSGEAPYNIILGAPEGVSMTLANEPVDLSRYNTGKVARFTLP